MEKKELLEITRATRTAAVQAVFAACFRGEKPGPALLRRFASGQYLDAGEGVRPDQALLAYLAKGVVAKKEELDAVIQPLLSAPIAKNDPLLVSILRAGAFEIMFREQTPKRVAVAEYTRLAADFLPAQKVALVNAVLDRIGEPAK